MSEEIRKPLADGLANIETTNSNFLRFFLEVMRPWHHLAPREMDFAAALLAKRFEIAKTFKNKADPSIDKLLFEEETKEEVMKKVGVAKAHMQVILRRLRENGVLEGKRVSPKYIPNWTEGKPFRMVFVFTNRDE